ncbi:MAG: hypothetical protein II171_02555 [Bacteroidales bacterium]|nr:hypothetical protein [Bacteroidales bacterium]
MKLKYIIASFMAAAAVLAGCEKEVPVSVLEGLTVSNDYLTLAADEGASATITVNGVADWTAAAEGADWLTIAPASGSAGQEVSVKFTATASEKARNVEVKITMGEKTKIIKVNQEAPAGVEVPPSTVKEIIDGPDKTYRVTGTITKITNTHYGNWYLNDGTVEGDGLYIYGTLDKKGADNSSSNTWDNLNDPNYANSWTLAVGDKVTIEGPRQVYNGTVELVNVTILKLEPSLIDVAAFDFDVLPSDESTFEMTVSSKAEPLLVTSDASWLQIVDVKEGGVYVLHADANDYTANRTATITIKAPGALKTVSVTQQGIPATGATVTEIAAMADDSQVETLECTVIAKSTRGIVVYDNTTALYVYDKEKFAEVKIGDNVKVFGKKTTYNGVPEITDVTEVKVFSSGNAFETPTPEDITAKAGEYSAAKAEYIKLTGTLVKSGNYYNLTLDAFPEGEKQGSINYPVEDLGIDAFVDKKITVTGWFNGLGSNGKFINMIATKIAEFVDNPKGTATNPYTASEACALITAGTTFDEDIYIKGKVSAILYTFSASYGTGTFWISDDGTAYGVTEDKKKTTAFDKDFECYSVYWFGSEKGWAEGNAQLEIGDEVVVCGKTTLYSGVAETASKKAWVYSVNGATTDENGVGNMNAPFNVAGAEAFIDRMNAAKAEAAANELPEPTFPDVCVKGKISAILYTFSASYGTGTFWLSDDGTAYGVTDDKKKTNAPDKDFECYSVYWGGFEKAWVDGDPQPEVGDEVIVKGQLTLYGTTYETSSKKAWVASYKGEAL